MRAAMHWCAALCAVAFLGLMVWTGAYPQRSQHVRFEARGLLRILGSDVGEARLGKHVGELLEEVLLHLGIVVVVVD